MSVVPEAEPLRAGDQGPAMSVVPEAEPILSCGTTSAPPPIARGSERLSSRLIAAFGRYTIVWLSLAVIAASEQPFDTAALVAVSFAAGLWLANLRTAAAGVPYALGPWVPALIGTTTGLVCVAAVNPHVPGLGLSLGSLLAAALGILVSVGIWESVLARTVGRRRVLVVGSSALPELVKAAERGPQMAFEVLGGPRERAVAAGGGAAATGAVLDGLTDIVNVQQPDLIVLADDRTFSAALDRLLDMGDNRFRVAGLMSFCEYALGYVPLQHITPLWFMSLLHVRQRPYSRCVKRGFDLMVAGVALLLTAPLLPLIALAVRLTPGPVIYRQTRLGEGGRHFTIYKFRTMVDGAERPGEAVWASDADPRTTPIGAFLRRSHLDELPQLWNVIKGDMSIVGPRPERPEFISLLEEGIPFWSRRLLIKPGVTGWAQVHYGYTQDCAGANEKLSYDLWYLRHRNLVVDLAVCVRTLRMTLASLLPDRSWLHGFRTAREHVPR